jgi:hypothetical protein
LMFAWAAISVTSLSVLKKEQNIVIFGLTTDLVFSLVLHVN